MVSAPQAVATESGAAEGPWLHSIHHRRGSFVLRCEGWRTLPGLTAVLGLNGAGKSTLLDLLSGRQQPSDGKAGEVDHFTLLPQDAAARVPQSVEDLYVYLAGLRGVARADRRAEAARVIDLCGLGEHRDSPVRALPGGWHQRVLIGQCLFGDPEGLLLDEPTSSLDVGAARSCWQLLAELSAQRPVVVATHEASAAFEFADHLVLIQHGEVGEPIAADELRSLRSTFDGSVEGFLLSLFSDPDQETA
jgi:ABC-2 type transport system ATP-binding protein